MHGPPSLVLQPPRPHGKAFTGGPKRGFQDGTMFCLGGSVMCPCPLLQQAHKIRIQVTYQKRCHYRHPIC